MAVVRTVSPGGRLAVLSLQHKQKGKNTTCVTLKMLLAVAVDGGRPRTCRCHRPTGGRPRHRHRSSGEIMKETVRCLAGWTVGRVFPTAQTKR